MLSPFGTYDYVLLNNYIKIKKYVLTKYAQWI